MKPFYAVKAPVTHKTALWWRGTNSGTVSRHQTLGTSQDEPIGCPREHSFECNRFPFIGTSGNVTDGWSFLLCGRAGGWKCKPGYGGYKTKSWVTSTCSRLAHVASISSLVSTRWLLELLTGRHWNALGSEARFVLLLCWFVGTTRAGNGVWHSLRWCART